MDLGENIYKCRVEQGLSQGGLADALGVSRQSVSKWENNSAVPELDKLVRMSEMFDVTLDELVHGKAPEKSVSETAAHAHVMYPNLSGRILIGCAMLLFGMVFFLLSIFWGDHLRFGEEFGELVSILIVLISVALIAAYNWAVMAICSVIYLIYGIICTGILHVHSVPSYVFMFLSGLVILVWFLVLGLHSSKNLSDA